LPLTSLGVAGVPSSEVPFLFEPPDPLLSLRALSGITSGVPFPPVAVVATIRVRFS
jgi:hypothetical protein